MDASFGNPVTPVLVAAVLVVIGLTVVAWAWAVRRPAGQPGSEGNVGHAQPVGSARHFTYAAIGASDVEGVGAEDPATGSWVNEVYSKLPPGTGFIRLGRGGITLAEALAQEIPQAIAARPDLVTLWNCVNDAMRGVTLEDYRRDLDAALRRLTRETGARVLLLNMPDVSLVTEGAPAENAELVRGGVLQWNQAIAEVAARYGGRVTVFDVFAVSDEVLQHPEYLSPDQFHPSSAGYKRLGDLVWAAIEGNGLLPT